MDTVDQSGPRSSSPNILVSKHLIPSIGDTANWMDFSVDAQDHAMI